MRKQRRVHRFHPLGELTALRIPSKKGKAGMLLDLGTRVGWRASRGGIDGWVAWGVGGWWGVVPESSAGATTTHYASFLRCGWWAREAGGGGTRLVWEQRRVGEGVV